MNSSADPGALGLRERKKIRTRNAIRDNAMRLFKEQGFAATTVFQIAEAADVSPSTFFRYFPNKDAVALTDDIDDLMIAAVRGAPEGLSALATLRHAFETTFDAMTDEAIAFEQQRQELISSVPELRTAMVDGFKHNVDLIRTLMAERTGVDPDSLEMKVFAGAVIGALLAVVAPAADYRRDVDAVLDRLEQGIELKLTGRPAPEH
ncbi:DNA-binding transcriptional regulator, AcrR family [Nakamurella panacisegetis]|uniref:DNA-binding transcriptional regulator, AcrR family n=1 Tax=Nakamurella panacisegetis TaxID=1090615 RepID=A0A1H0IN30_9ACTN|nr:TetR family transcriptional regulator [Nakamurella panacisegetis]SDO32765.1 DNA-binding transcriptional regulator, AcrR family [Nakamurella panacisegetis]